MTISHLSNDSLQRLLWLNAACSYLMDYRKPGYILTSQERDGLATYLDSNMSACDAAEAYQATA